MPIKRVKLGKTDLEVPILGYGASPLGGVFGEIDKADAFKSVQRAIEAGVNYFDTSPFYGITKSETVLGEALAASSFSRSDYIIATKVGRYGPTEFDFSRERTLQSIEESLQRLQTDYIDVIQCHDIEFGDIDQVVNQCIPTLLELKAAGKVRYIGITGLPLGCLKSTYQRLSPNSIDFILSYCKDCMLDTTLIEYLPFFRQQGLGVINASPLSMGLLTHQGPQPWHPASEATKAACRRAAEYCASRGLNLPEIALRYSICNLDNADITLSGMASCDLLDANLAAIAKGPVEKEVVDAIAAILAPVHNHSWKSGAYADDVNLA